MTSSAFASRKITIGLPVVVTLVLGLLAGGLQTVNQVVLTDYPQWQHYIAIIVVLIAALGVNPLLGSAFVSALHLSPRLFALVTLVIATMAGALQTVPLPHVWALAFTDVLTVLAALGFGSNPAQEPISPILASAARPAESPPPLLAAPEAGAQTA